jgi:hypothetical protein
MRVSDNMRPVAGREKPHGEPANAADAKADRLSVSNNRHCHEHLGVRNVNPTSTDIRLINARAVARNLRDAAQLCMCDQAAVRARLIQAAQTIDEIALMAEASTFVAKLNHDTIMEISR